MELDLVALLKEHPELVLFVLLALAYLIGNLRIGKLDLGAPPGILIAGLLFGHLGFDLFPGIETIGLFLFLYAVAFQAGPAFFSVVLADGSKYVLLAALATAVGFGLTFLFDAIFNFAPGVAAGLLAGSLTSPAGVAAALDAVRTGSVPIPTGVSPTSITENTSVSYAITYLIGDVGVILLARGIPGLLRFDLKREAAQAAAENHVVEGDAVSNPSAALTLRAYQVKNADLVGKTVSEVQYVTECSVLGCKRDGAVIEFQPEMPIQLGDRLSVWGRIEQQDYLDNLFGAEVADSDLIGLKLVDRVVTITQPAAIGKTLAELDVTKQYACYITRVSRAGIDLNLSPDLQLENGDVLTISGPASRLDKLADQIGYVERNVNATDLMTFAAGVVVGFLIGQIRLGIGSLDISLGAPGGLLLVGILLGYYRSIHPTFGRVPPATLWVFKELGLLLFLAGVGVEGGKGIAKAMTSLGPMILLCSVVIATLPVIVAFGYGRYVLKMNPALLLGASTGAVTCTPAMAAVSEDAKSSIPTIGYAGTYAFATVFSAIACSLMARF
jgi:putative transport protein